jgi:hypothetical protein
MIIAVLFCCRTWVWHGSMKVLLWGGRKSLSRGMSRQLCVQYCSPLCAMITDKDCCLAIRWTLHGYFELALHHFLGLGIQLSVATACA